MGSVQRYEILIEKTEKGLSQVKSFGRAFFKSSQGLRGQRPSSTSAEVETPRRQKEFLFLVLFLLDKGEKVQIHSMDIKQG